MSYNIDDIDFSGEAGDPLAPPSKGASSAYNTLLSRIAIAGGRENGHCGEACLADAILYRHGFWHNRGNLQVHRLRKQVYPVFFQYHRVWSLTVEAGYRIAEKFTASMGEDSDWGKVVSTTSHDTLQLDILDAYNRPHIAIVRLRVFADREDKRTGTHVLCTRTLRTERLPWLRAARWCVSQQLSINMWMPEGVPIVPARRSEESLAR